MREQINCGDGNGVEPGWSPSGRSSFHRPERLRWRVSVRRRPHADTAAAGDAIRGKVDSLG
jgi:hypothetical protein